MVVLHACFVSSLLVSSAAGLSVGENISGICCNSIQEGKNTELGVTDYCWVQEKMLCLLIDVCTSMCVRLSFYRARFGQMYV